MLPPDSRYLGKELAEHHRGAGAARHRAHPGRAAAAPRCPSYRLVGDERIIIEGKREDILRVKDLQGIDIRPDVRLADEELRSRDAVLVEASVPPGSPLVGRSLKEVLFVERYGLVALALHRKPAIQRLTKLQMLGRIFGEQSLSAMPLSVGDVLLLRGPRSRVAELADGTTLLVLRTWSTSRRATRKALLAVCIFLGALAAGTLGLVPMSVAGLAGMLAMIVTGCVDARIAFRVDWRVVLLIGSMMALGVAMEVSGAGKYLGRHGGAAGRVRRATHGAGAADGADHPAVGAHEQPGGGAGGAAGGRQRGGAAGRGRAAVRHRRHAGGELLVHHPAGAQLRARLRPGALPLHGLLPAGHAADGGAGGVPGVRWCRRCGPSTARCQELAQAGAR